MPPRSIPEGSVTLKTCFERPKSSQGIGKCHLMLGLKLEHDTWLTKALRFTKWLMCTCGEKYTYEYSSASRGERAMPPPPPPGPVKISHKKMAVEGSRIDFMFLAPVIRPLDPLLEYTHEQSS